MALGPSARPEEFHTEPGSGATRAANEGVSGAVKGRVSLSMKSYSFLNEMVGQHPMEFPRAQLPFPGASGLPSSSFVLVDWHI